MIFFFICDSRTNPQQLWPFAKNVGHPPTNRTKVRRLAISETSGWYATWMCRDSGVYLKGAAYTIERDEKFYIYNTPVTQGISA